MAVRTVDELLNAVREIIGENDSDEALGLIEDITDTFTENQGDGTDWKEKYEENDREWRQRYRDRFFNTGANDPDPIDDPDPEPEPQKTKYEELFKEG